MNEAVIAKLKRPFAQELIRHRRGSDGSQLAYVEISHYIERLDEAFEHDWSYELTKREVVGEQVVVEVKLTAGGMVKTGLDGVTITRQGGGIVSLADDVKMAEAGALRRACRLFGIGAQLYAAEQDDDGGLISGPSRANDNSQPPTGSHTLPFGDRAHAPRERLTSAQLNAIRTIIKKKGIEPAAFRQGIKKEFGVEVEYLSKRQASEVISGLDGKKPGNGSGDARAWAGQP